MIILQVLHSLSAILMSILGLNALVLAFVYFFYRNKNASPAVNNTGHWPHVLIQLPLFNERHVVERLINAVAKFDYPRDHLVVQVLDDSTDDTVSIVAAAVERAAGMGINIQHVQREKRRGYKAGALEFGLRQSDAEFVAIFDADFVPPPDFLKNTIPYFLNDEKLGMVQTRWAYMNAEFSLLTRAQAIALDNHFVIEQTARNRANYLMNFSGTAGVWRRTCITDSGGWQHDTLSEDIDLTYRAQIGGWKCLYLPDMGTLSEITPLMMGFKRQQARWATGNIQCLKKLGPTIIESTSLTLWQKFQAIMHLCGYLTHPLMLVMLIATLPLMLDANINSPVMVGLTVAMFGPPLQCLMAQRRIYKDWGKRFLFFPMLMLIGVGIAPSNTYAIWQAVSKRTRPFYRTPKFQVDPKTAKGNSWINSEYALPIDPTTFIEIFLAFYAGLTAFLSLVYNPSMTVFMILYASGFAYVAGLSIWQSYAVRRYDRKRRALELSETNF